MSGVPTTVSTAVLRAVPLFSSVPDEQLRTLATVVTRKSLARGATRVLSWSGLMDFPHKTNRLKYPNLGYPN